MGSCRVFAGLRRRWAPAKLFNEQLSKLAESEQNIRHLNRLQGLIEDGMALQVRAPCEGVRLFLPVACVRFERGRGGRPKMWCFL